MPKSFEEIVNVFFDPIVKNVSDFASVLAKEPDIREDQAKKGLLNFIEQFLHDYEEIKDGDFETFDKDLISETDLTNATSGAVAVMDEPAGNLVDDGPEPEDDDSDYPYDEEEEFDDEEYEDEFDDEDDVY